MEKYTIILLHYNQMDYIHKAISSVMNQTYNNVELIVADDCSPQFDYDKIEKIIKKYNKKNFEYKILSMKENSGTIKNLNNAMKNSTGDFIHFLASDDVLYDDKVVEKFVKEFDDKTKNILTAQCLMCDDELKNGKPYVDVKMALKLNALGTKALYEKMSEYCIYCSGGTVYRKSIIEKYNLFDEKYQFIEDWSSWLYLLRNHEMIYYVDFVAYKHRDGGISHSEYTIDTLPKHVKTYYKELLEITVNEVLPYINDYTIIEQYRIFRRFYDCTNYFGRFVPELYSYNKYIDMKKSENKKFAFYWRFRKIYDIIKVNYFLRIKNLFTNNIVVPISFIVWLISCLILNNSNFIENKNILLVYLLMYLLSFIIVYEINKIFYISKKITEYNIYKNNGRKEVK